MRRRITIPLARVLAPAAALVLAASALLATPATAATSTAPDQWTGLYGDAGSAADNPGEHVITPATASKVRTAWTADTRNLGPYSPVVLGGVAYTIGTSRTPVFTAMSPRTGAVLWTLTLPYAYSAYGYGMTGTGSTVLVSFRTDPAGGVLAVNVAKHPVAWRAFFPASTISWIDRSYPGIPTTDGTNVYLSGSSNIVNTYSVATGRLLWTIPIVFNSNGTEDGVTGVAAGGGVLYTAGARGINAYSAATGKHLWQSTGVYSWYQPPVLAGGRVFISEPSAVAAFPAAGCGAATCKPTWTWAVDNWDEGAQLASDGTSVFASYRTQRSGGSGQCVSPFVGNITRLSAATGKPQWHLAVGTGMEGLVTAGGVLWAFNDDVVQCAGGERVVAYSAATTGSTPLFSKQLSTDVSGYPAALAVASGTVFQTAMQRILIAYRVPGT